MKSIFKIGLQFCQAVLVSLMTIVLLLGAVFLPASFAAPLPPNAVAYGMETSDNSAVEAGEPLKQRASDYKQALKSDVNDTSKTIGKAIEAPKNQLEKAVDTVVEKLNLNEPLPESTKEFLHQAEDKVSETVEPVVEGRPGFFKAERNP